MILEKPCNLCGVMDTDIQYFLPTSAVSKIYKKLVRAGEASQALLFLVSNKNSFTCFCTKCWVTDFTIGAMLDEDTTDEQKIDLINAHIDVAMQGYDKDLFWSKLGNPDLN